MKQGALSKLTVLNERMGWERGERSMSDVSPEQLQMGTGTMTRVSEIAKEGYP